MKIEIELGDDMVDKAIDAIRQAAPTERIGDGKISLSNIEEAIQIRTGEAGRDAAFAAAGRNRAPRPLSVLREIRLGDGVKLQVQVAAHLIGKDRANADHVETAQLSCASFAMLRATTSCSTRRPSR